MLVYLDVADLRTYQPDPRVGARGVSTTDLLRNQLAAADARLAVSPVHLLEWCGGGRETLAETLSWLRGAFPSTVLLPDIESIVTCELLRATKPFEYPLRSTLPTLASTDLDNLQAKAWKSHQFEWPSRVMMPPLMDAMLRAAGSDYNSSWSDTVALLNELAQLVPANGEYAVSDEGRPNQRRATFPWVPRRILRWSEDPLTDLSATDILSALEREPLRLRLRSRSRTAVVEKPRLFGELIKEQQQRKESGGCLQPCIGLCERILVFELVEPLAQRFFGSPDQMHWISLAPHFFWDRCNELGFVAGRLLPPIRPDGSPGIAIADGVRRARLHDRQYRSTFSDAADDLHLLYTGMVDRMSVDQRALNWIRQAQRAQPSFDRNTHFSLSQTTLSDALKSAR
jgi:hypothetical protein